MREGVIKKANNLIRSPFTTKLQDGTEVSGKTHIVDNGYANLTEKEYDLLDVLLEIVQTAYKARKGSLLDFLPNDEHSRVFVIGLAQLKKLVGIKNRGDERIEDVISGLTNKKIKLKQQIYIQTPNESKRILEISDNTTLIEKSTLVKETLESDTYKQVEFKFSKLFMALAHEEVYLASGYTDIDRCYVKNIRGKIAKALYQMIHSWSHNLAENEKRTIVLSKEELIAVCGEQPHFAHYKRKLLSAIPKIEQYKIVFLEQSYKKNVSIELLVEKAINKISL